MQVITKEWLAFEKESLLVDWNVQPCGQQGLDGRNGLIWTYLEPDRATKAIGRSCVQSVGSTHLYLVLGTVHYFYIEYHLHADIRAQLF